MSSVLTCAKQKEANHPINDDDGFFISYII